MRHNGDFRSNGGGMELARALAAAIGMAGPVIAGFAAGNAPAGFAACAGGLMAAGAARGRSGREDLSEIAHVLAPAIAASAVAALVAGRGAGADAAVVLLAACVSLAGAMSRAGAVAAVRFVLFLLVAIGVAENVAERWQVVALVGAGACGAAIASLVTGAIARGIGWRAAPRAPEPAPFSRAQRFARWRRSLRTLAGWQYALRLTACLAAAALLDAAWPGHHMRWAAITVVLLTERQPEPWPRKAMQRALGTFAGVMLAAVVFTDAIAGGVLALAIAILAAARVLLRDWSYAASTAATTPLILAILDAGEPADIALLLDRLAATLVGAALVLAANALLRRAGIGAGSGPGR